MRIQRQNSNPSTRNSGSVTIEMTEAEARLLRDLAGGIGHDALAAIFIRAEGFSFDEKSEIRLAVTTPIWNQMSHLFPDLPDDRTRSKQDMMRDVREVRRDWVRERGVRYL